MSNESQPQDTQPENSEAPSVAEVAPEPETPSHQPVAAKPRQISMFLKVSIVLLAALSIASISLLFIGDFEGKFERVFSTFIAFAIFVVLTAIDTRRELRGDWYAPVALIANSYILALLLIVIWMTPSGWWLGWDIFWKSVLVIAVTRAVVGCAQILLNLSEGKPKPLGVFALVTSLLATVSGILFTAPAAIELFNVRVPDLYWRFAVASLLLTALGLAITLLLRWAYTGPDREAARRARAAAQAVQAQHYPSPTFPTGAPGAGMPVAPAAPTVQIAEAPATAPAMQPGTQQPVATNGQPLLPWPTFPDGRPLPVGPDGQPDFSALNR